MADLMIAEIIVVFVGFCLVAGAVITALMLRDANDPNLDNRHFALAMAIGTVTVGLLVASVIALAFALIVVVVGHIYEAFR